MESRYYFKPNTIYCGDNLKILKSFPDECVDLIYIDPPFFSGKNYDIVFKDPVAVKRYGSIKKHKNGKSEDIIFRDMFDGELKKYLSFMRNRIVELRRVLKPEGSFYIHCDWHAGHYLKRECDKIFGGWNKKDEDEAENKEEYNWECIEKGRKFFQNEIVWCYRTGGATKKRFSRKHDTIFFYSKEKVFNFNSIKERIYYEKPFFNPNIDENGKYYADVLPVDFWEIPAVINVSKEREGYPTQKPEKLLEKIIKASSNEGDIVLDAFCGCGTTLAVAKRLKRYFVGFDKSPVACFVMLNRINDMIDIKNDKIVKNSEKEKKMIKNNIIGLKDALEKMSEMDAHLFQVWAIRQIKGIANTYKEEKNKKGISFGVDGWLDKKKTILIEVKRERIINPNYITIFAGRIRDRDLSKGIFIGLERLTSGAITKISLLKEKEGIDITFINLDSLFDKKNLIKSLIKKGIIKRTGQIKDDI